MNNNCHGHLRNPNLNNHIQTRDKSFRNRCHHLLDFPTDYYAEGDDEDLLRYTVFAQARLIQQGFSPDDPRAYEKGLDDFPNRAEAENKLRKAGLRLN